MSALETCRPIASLQCLTAGPAQEGKLFAPADFDACFPQVCRVATLWCIAFQACGRRKLWHHLWQANSADEAWCRNKHVPSLLWLCEPVCCSTHEWLLWFRYTDCNVGYGEILVLFAVGSDCLLRCHYVAINSWSLSQKCWDVPFFHCCQFAFSESYEIWWFFPWHMAGFLLLPLHSPEKSGWQKSKCGFDWKFWGFCTGSRFHAVHQVRQYD